MKFLLLFLTLFTFHPQDEPEVNTWKECYKSHPTEWDFWQSQRVVPYLKIITIDREAKLVYFKFEERKQVMLGSLKLIPDGVYYPNFESNFNDYFLFVYCQKHLVLLRIEKMEKREIRQAPKVRFEEFYE